jgi:hypothetical protein
MEMKEEGVVPLGERAAEGVVAYRQEQVVLFRAERIE